MLKLPGSADDFLARYWQKAPLFIPGALDRLRPRVTRNELGWLATLDDVESRIVFAECSGTRTRYKAETGPFDPEYLAALPERGWTLLVHDVEKHLPVMRRLLAHVPFIPDWRIDDLMVSFAAPGGGVGPHTDNYDVFLCQGIGVREWRVTREQVPDDARASDELALKIPFGGDLHVARRAEGIGVQARLPRHDRVGAAVERSHRHGHGHRVALGDGGCDGRKSNRSRGALRTSGCGRSAAPRSPVRPGFGERSPRR